MHSKKGIICSDMDGVICENCPPGVDADEDRYLEWLDNAKPYMIPAFEIDVIVSGRLEKYREQTEHWLKKYKVRYKELCLWDLESKELRLGNYVKHKIDVILKTKPDMVFESEHNQAEEIWKATHVTTICTDDMIIFS